jgi:hypothetical protein
VQVIVVWLFALMTVQWMFAMNQWTATERASPISL